MSSIKKYILIFVGILLIISTAVFLWQFGAFNWLFLGVTGAGELMLPLVVVSALIDSVNPCAISLLFLMIAFLFASGWLRSRILRVGGAYVFGIFIVYFAIGLGIMQAMYLFNVPNFMGKIGAVLLVLLGTISLVSVFMPEFSIKFRIPRSMHKKIAILMEKGSVASAFMLGGLVGIFEFPCTGGAYLMILGLLHDQGTHLQGLWYLLIYNIIFVLPLIVILFIASNKVVLSKMDTWRKENSRSMRLWSGVVMIIIGAIVLAI